MRILFLAPQVPWPANKGDRQRSFALLRALAERHEITLSAPASVDEASLCREALGTLINRFIPVSTELGCRGKIPSSVWRLDRLFPYAWDLVTQRTPYGFRYKNNAYTSKLLPHYGTFDAVFCRYLYMLPVVQGFAHSRTVVDVDDLHYLGLLRSSLNLSDGWSTPTNLPEALRSYCYEQRSFRRVARVLVCSQQDFSRILSKRKTVVRNGIDKPKPGQLRSQPRPRTFIFVGQMTYGPNTEALRWFLRSVWPRVRTLVPTARLLVVGRGASVDSLSFARCEGVEIVGEVEETASWFSSAVLSVAPLRVGLGTRIKILESLACGRPVVATKIGAEGLEDINEQAGLFRVNNPRMMAERIACLLSQPELAMSLGARGRALIETRYTWEVTTRELAHGMEQWISMHGTQREHPRNSAESRHPHLESPSSFPRT